MTSPPPPVRIQGRAIVESDGDGGFLLMTPDGQVEWAPDRAGALRKLKKWAKADADDEAINALVTEWRVPMPEGENDEKEVGS